MVSPLEQRNGGLGPSWLTPNPCLTSQRRGPGPCSVGMAAIAGADIGPERETSTSSYDGEPSGGWLRGES